MPKKTTPKKESNHTDIRFKQMLDNQLPIIFRDIGCVDFSTFTVVDSVTKTVLERRADFLYQIEKDSIKSLLHLEFERTKSEELLQRMFL
jgi:hypothetical protein